MSGGLSARHGVALRAFFSSDGYTPSRSASEGAVVAVNDGERAAVF